MGLALLSMKCFGPASYAQLYVKILTIFSLLRLDLSKSAKIIIIGSLLTSFKVTTGLGY